MSYYGYQKIQEDVRVIMDSNRVDSSLLSAGDVETLKLDELIESKILEATRHVMLIAPSRLVGTGITLNVDDNDIVWKSSKGHGSGKIKLPEDFLRLIAFQMSDWSYPVSEYITETSPMYPRQHSAYAGIRGNPKRPVVAIINEYGGPALEFFSCNEGPTVQIKQFVYLSQPLVLESRVNGPSTSIGIPDDLYNAVIYYIAYLVASSIEMNNANFFLTTSNTYLE